MVKRFHYVLWVTLFLLLVLNCVLSGESDSAKPEKVYRIVYVQKPNEWYIQQTELWKKEIEKNPKNPEREVRIACRDSFRQSRLLHRIIPSIEEVLSAGGLPFPKRPEESVAPAIPNKESVGDAGHRG